jgi:hypothetical protein
VEEAHQPLRHPLRGLEHDCSHESIADRHFTIATRKSSTPSTFPMKFSLVFWKRPWVALRQPRYPSRPSSTDRVRKPHPAAAATPRNLAARYRPRAHTNIAMTPPVLELSAPACRGIERWPRTTPSIWTHQAKTRFVHLELGEQLPSL